MISIPRTMLAELTILTAKYYCDKKSPWLQLSKVMMMVNINIQTLQLIFVLRVKIIPFHHESA